MITEAKAKKGTGLDDLFKDYVPQQLEEIKKTTFGSNTLVPLLEAYGKLLNNEIIIPFLLVDSKVSNDIKEEWAPFKEIIRSHILRPQEIAAFLAASDVFETQRCHEVALGVFTNAIIQQSYLAGHNNFAINGKGTIAIDSLAADLHGTKQNPLEIHLSGNLGNRIAPWSSYISLHVNPTDVPDVSFIGWKAKNVRIRIAGNAVDVGAWAQDSYFHIDGNVSAFKMGPILYGASRCTCLVTGDVEYSRRYNLQAAKKFNYAKRDPRRIQDCTFKTTNEKTLHTFLENVPLEERYGNKVVFVYANGDEELKNK